MLEAIRAPTLLDIGKLIFIGAIWGSSFIFNAIALNDFAPLSIAAWRVLLATVVMVAIVLLSGRVIPRGWRNWRYIFVVGCLNSAVPFFLISWGQQFISPAETALLLATGTFCSLLVSHFTSVDERINRYRALGVCIGFAGVLLLVLWDLLEADAGGLKGQIAVTAAGCSYAVSSIISRRISHLSSISVSAATLASACLYMLPMALLLANPLPDQADIGPVLSLVYLGVVATALAMTIRFMIIRANGAVFTSQVGYLVPLFGVIWSALFFTHTINWQTLLALLLILLGIAVARKGN